MLLDIVYAVKWTGLNITQQLLIVSFIFFEKCYIIMDIKTSNIFIKTSIKNYVSDGRPKSLIIGKLLAPHQRW